MAHHHLTKVNKWFIGGGYVTQTDPVLRSLLQNGSRYPSDTHALAKGNSNPARRTGDSRYCPRTDQRGFPRAVYPVPCDIGAYEN